MQVVNRDQALKFKMPFGKYEGKTLAEVQGKDPEYLDWLENELDWENYPALTEALAWLSVGGK